MIFTENTQYSNAKPYLKLVRDAVEGEPAIKRETTVYLKHPNAIDKTSPAQKLRYECYIDGAEFDGFPAETESGMLGQMLSGDIDYEFPDKIDYLFQDSDGDGIGIEGAAELIYRNLLEAKYHFLLAEYVGLTGLNTESLSVADIKKIKPRASIKHYDRESLIDWEFARINGVMQLTLAVLCESATTRDDELKKTEVKSYLVLALDENGDYHQKKYVQQTTATSGTEYVQDGVEIYPMVGGRRLKWIPCQIVVDSQIQAGKMPSGLGYLYPICALSLYRYRVSADHKEALRLMQPTTFTRGWKDGDKELFKEINGRDYIAFGAGVANNLPEGVEVDIQGLGVETEPFNTYYEQSELKIKALGGKIDTGKDGQAITATESASNSARNTAVMDKIVRNTEAALKRMVVYCGMFEGLWGADAIEENLDKITLNLPKDFGIKLTGEQVTSVLSAVTAGVIPKEEGTKILAQGKFTVSNVDELLSQLETQPQIIK